MHTCPQDGSGRHQENESTRLCVSHLTTVPVKGTKLHQPEAVRLGWQGIEGDRLYYFVDARGRPINGRRLGPLATIRSSYDELSGSLTLVFPNGRTVSGVPVRVGNSLVSDFFSHDVKGWLVEGPWSQALSQHFGAELRLVETDSPGDACDRHPLSIVSSASIAYLAAKAGSERAAVEFRRFRMMIEIDGCCPHEEDTWEGSLIQVGSARVRVLEAIPRCSVIRQDPGTGEPTLDLLKLLHSYRNAGSSEAWPIRQAPGERQVMFGRYGQVVEPGEVRVGDAVQVLMQPEIG